MISLVLAGIALSPPTPHDWVEFRGGKGPGKGKNIVFLSGDEEYRSEEGLVQLARILAARHGFHCTVLFSIDPNGDIDPNIKDNEPGLEALDKADLCVMLLRFREWPDGQMKHFADFYRAGKPILALRTSTHAFAYRQGSSSIYQKFGYQSTEWPGGFGKHVLGETWVSHWGDHGHQATRGVVPEGEAKNPILKGVHDVFGDTDVYEASPPSDARILLYGQVVSGMDLVDPPATNRKTTTGGVEQGVNDPMMPIAWIRHRPNELGKSNWILTCTMGAATDLLNEGLRRFLVNGVYWEVGLKSKISGSADVGLVGTYTPTKFGFDGFRRGVKPSQIEGVKE